MDSQQLVGAIAALFALLTSFAGAVIKYQANEISRLNAKIDKSSDLVTKLTALVEKMAP